MIDPGSTSPATDAAGRQLSVALADDHTVVRQGLHLLIDNEDGMHSSPRREPCPTPSGSPGSTVRPCSSST